MGMEIRWAQRPDLPQIHSLWKQVFGDAPGVQAALMSGFGGIQQVLLLLEDGVVRSMTCLPVVTLRRERAGEERIAYLYALATHPEARGRGLAARLMARGEELLAKEGCEGVALVPAQPSLFDYYGRLGYAPAFFHCRWEGTAEGLPAPQSVPVQVDAEAYQRLRAASLSGMTWVDYPLPMLRLQELFSRLTHGGLYRLELPGGTGCAVVEGRGKEMWVKELLCAPGDGREALAQLVQLQPAVARWRVCSPTEVGLGGQRCPFGVFHGRNGQAPVESAYLGLAFD